MWIENQDGDLLNADRLCKIERVRTWREEYDEEGGQIEGPSQIAAYVSDDEWDLIATGLTPGEAKAFIGQLAESLATNTYFDTRETLREIRLEIVRFHSTGTLGYDSDACEAKGETDANAN